MNPKQIAAERAVSYIEDGMTVGLGTGSTAAYAIAALGARLQSENLRLTCIATSVATERFAESAGIPLAAWDSVRRFDITVDGADEVDPEFRLIKGGGGALVREKLVAAVTDHEIIMVDDGKMKESLGGHVLPVVVIPFAWQSTRDRLESKFNRSVLARKQPDGELFVTDEGMNVLDIAFGAPLPDPDHLEAKIKQVVGVVEIGLFVGLCHRVIIGFADGRVEERLR